MQIEGLTTIDADFIRDHIENDTVKLNPGCYYLAPGIDTGDIWIEGAGYNDTILVIALAYNISRGINVRNLGIYGTYVN